ncbi:MAG: hypothetical protein A3J74_09310 [Elusimicrobia bacterium RIFCSPHIGHO2_02_FULL_57_9]|nr:MAG: hypothetical protein A3J74_09310 [Elusimicrobia bacterium RIFCSPHIGHO2_02_FULL_57_9]
MPTKKSLAVRLNSQVAERMRRYCAERGIKQGFFIEKALLEQIEREELNEDLLDFKKHRSHEKDAISFEEYLRLRRSHV